MKGNNAFVEKLVSDHFTRNCDLFAHASLGILITDSGGRIIRKNTTVEEITGISAEDSDIFAGGKIRYFDQQNKILSWDEMPAATALRTRKIVDNVEIGTSLNKGSVRWSAVTAVPLDSGYNYVVVIFRDIMESRILTARLTESETRYRSLYENSFDAIMLTDPSGPVISANPAACRMLGMTEDEIRHLGREELIDTTDPAYLPAVEERKAKNRFCGELTMIRGNGEKFPVELSSSVFETAEGRKYTSMIIRDITARRSSLEKLHESEEGFRLLSENGGISVGFYSVDGKVLFMNRKTAEYFDGNPEDFTGRDLREIVGDRTGNKHLKRIVRASLTGRVFTFEDRVNNKNGDEWYSSIYSRVCNPAGEVIGVQILSKNITRQKNTELKLRQVTSELREHTNRLQDMIENERLQLSRDLHDVVGQRLAALNFYCSWLRTKIGDKVEGIDSAMNDIIDILNDTIKSVVEMSYGLRPDILDELGLCSAVEWQIAEFRRTFNIECSAHFLPSGIDTDKNLSLAVFRIIQEALTNISRHSKATRASVGINMKKNNLRIVIRDNGIGIDTAILTSLKSLGLIGMKERARAFGGEVYFTNLKGRGTRILALFPLKYTAMN